MKEMDKERLSLLGYTMVGSTLTIGATVGLLYIPELVLGIATLGFGKKIFDEIKEYQQAKKQLNKTQIQNLEL